MDGRDKLNETENKLDKRENRLISFIKSEPVLSAAWILAIASMFVVRPDLEYLGYVDFRTLAILFCLMSVVAGFRAKGVFDYFAGAILSRAQGMGIIVTTLVLLCFFMSMLITNDVALITFVPFAMIVLSRMGHHAERLWLVPVVAMQTIAANLGSMFTPIGSPQNLYLFSQFNVPLTDFLVITAPYVAVAGGLLMVWIVLRCAILRAAGVTGGSFFGNYSMLSGRDISEEYDQPDSMATLTATRVEMNTGMWINIALFALCLLTVAKLVPYPVTLAVVLVTNCVFDRNSIRAVDYSLLLTFVGFFIFIGNMGRIPAFSKALASIIEGREVLTAALASQVISNVPAALLLSGFTDRAEALIIGTNFGGLGTLIASMASLISFRYISREHPETKGKYLLVFTLSNVLFLAALMVFHFVVRGA